MGSDSVDPAVIHDNDPVAVFYAGNTLCDDQFGRAGNFLPESLSDLCVCCSVHSAGAVIQNQYFGLFEQCPRDTEPLSLSAGYISASLFDPGIVALRHFSDKFICAGHFTYSHALFFRGVFVSPPQIVKYRAAEQDVFLKDDSFNSSYVKWEVVMQKVINILYSAATECGLQGQIPFTMQKIKEGEKDVLKPYVYDKSGTIDAMDAMYTNIDTLQIGKIAFRTQTEYQTRSFRFSAYSEANMPSTFSVTNKNGDKKTYLLTGLIKSGYLTIDRNNLTPVYLVSQTEAEELKKDSNKKLKQSTGVIGLYELIEQGETDDDDDED